MSECAAPAWTSAPAADDGRYRCDGMDHEQGQGSKDASARGSRGRCRGSRDCGGSSSTWRADLERARRRRDKAQARSRRSRRSRSSWPQPSARRRPRTRHAMPVGTPRCSGRRRGEAVVAADADAIAAEPAESCAGAAEVRGEPAAKAARTRPSGRGRQGCGREQDRGRGRKAARPLGRGATGRRRGRGPDAEGRHARSRSLQRHRRPSAALGRARAPTARCRPTGRLERRRHARCGDEARDRRRAAAPRPAATRPAGRVAATPPSLA